VTPSCDGAYRISCTRLGGDTFRYHDALRQLRQHLGDAVHSSAPLREGGQPAMGSAAAQQSGATRLLPMAAPRGMGMALAPMPVLLQEAHEDASSRTSAASTATTGVAMMDATSSSSGGIDGGGGAGSGRA